MIVDMHMHTYYSDGTMSPAELVAKGKERHVGIMAITDHHTIESWESFETLARAEGIIPIRGVEINARFEDKVLHVLGYGFKPTKRLTDMLGAVVDEMEQMSIDVMANLEKEDKRVSLQAYNATEKVLGEGGWKGIQYLVATGVIEKLGDGMAYYRSHGKPLLDYHFPALEEVCQVIQEAGGYAVLAHPATSYGKLIGEDLDEKLEEIKAMGIQGIECYYPTHTEAYTEQCVAFCKKHDLLITTGGDEHGGFGEQVKTLDQTVGCMQVDSSKLNLGNLI